MFYAAEIMNGAFSGIPCLFEGVCSVKITAGLREFVTKRPVGGLRAVIPCHPSVHAKVHRGVKVCSEG